VRLFPRFKPHFDSLLIPLPCLLCSISEIFWVSPLFLSVFDRYLRRKKERALRPLYRFLTTWMLRTSAPPQGHFTIFLSLLERISSTSCSHIMLLSQCGHFPRTADLGVIVPAKGRGLSSGAPHQLCPKFNEQASPIFPSRSEEVPPSSQFFLHRWGYLVPRSY